ncbi:MAG: class III cytochrome C family protein [Proteobacteria bacterium]|nr:class III cytochrome C family protein [Pseudomonadota bacterium]
MARCPLPDRTGIRGASHGAHHRDLPVLGLEVKSRPALMLIAANVLALVALAFIYPHLMVSPGPLLSSHAELTNDCFACHSPWRGTDAKRCMQCHAPAEIGLRTTKGVRVARQSMKISFHQELTERDCMACHSEHQGVQLTERVRIRFSHTLLRSAIRERCESCHTAPNDAIHRQIGSNCGQCHSAQVWKPATFDHAKLFVLDRNHTTECATCHVNTDFSRYTCYGCHAHEPARVRAQHLEEGIRDIADCVKCHRSARESYEGGPREGRERD